MNRVHPTSDDDPPRRIVITRRGALDVRDGINIFIFALADALLRRGHEATILATHVGDEDRLRALYGIRGRPGLEAVENRPTRLALEGLTPGWLTRGRRRVRELAPDLVINNGALPFTTPGRTLNLAHDLGWLTSPRRFDGLRLRYKRFAYERGDDVVALCPEVGLGIAAQLGRPIQRVVVIPPCVATETITTDAGTSRDDAILHTGTGEYKNPGASVRAFAALERPTTRLLIEGAVTTALQDQVRALAPGVRSRIEFLGELAAVEIGRRLRTVRVAAFPTRYTVPTASATVVEAIAAGTPIAGSHLLSTSVLRDDGNGIACADDAALAAAFQRLLAVDDDWRRMSAGSTAMAGWFGADRVAAHYLSLIGAQVP